MLELRIRITSENAEKVIRLIREIVGLEETTSVQVEATEQKAPILEKASYLNQPPEFNSLTHGNIVPDGTSEYVGTWGQFNSFFPMKAALRVLSHLMKENNEKPVSLQTVVDESLQAFKKVGLQKFRGFPKRYRRESSIGRLVGHFITTAQNMGLIKVQGEIGSSHWDQVLISITIEGWEFAGLDNRIFDGKSVDQVLTESERLWLTKYLKRIDAAGFKEYTFLKQVFDELKAGNSNISAWLEKNDNFREYIKSWSRKTENEEEFENQLKTVAVTFAQSKIALLRELGVVRNQRGDYTIIGNLGE
jgi:hypothetical protein